VVGVPAGTIPGWEKEFLENCMMQESRNYQDFKPPIYNVWKKQEKTNSVSQRYFSNVPYLFLYSLWKKS
jgi:hypothetical protein